MAQMFTQQPKSGNARKLWDWFTKSYGIEPDHLIVMRPGRHQAAGGVFPYTIRSVALANGNDFAIYNPDVVLKSTALSRDEIETAIYLHGHIDLG